MIQHLTNRN